MVKTKHDGLHSMSGWLAVTSLSIRHGQLAKQGSQFTVTESGTMEKGT